MILAVDPGKKGGIAIADSRGVHVYKMPETQGDIINIIRRHTRQSNEATQEKDMDKDAYVEQIVKHMGEGIPASTMAVYASNWGFILGALMFAGWSVNIIGSKEWQKALGLGGTGRHAAPKLAKGASVLAKRQHEEEKKKIKNVNAGLKRDWKNKLKGEAQRLFPDHCATLSTADALLILRYAMLRQWSENNPVAPSLPGLK